MESIEWKQHVTRDDELRVAISARGVSSEGIIARHVCVHDLDLVPANEARQLVRTLHVEGVPQRQGFDFGGIDLELIDQRRTRAHCNVKIVTALMKAVGQIGNISLAAAERCR